MSKPRLPNWDLANQLGFNPKTGEYTGKNAGYENLLHDNIKKNLRIMDEQQFVHRYKWYGLPPGLTEDIMERILYYRGVGMFCYVEENKKFYFLPATEDGLMLLRFPLLEPTKLKQRTKRIRR